VQLDRLGGREGLDLREIDRHLAHGVALDRQLATDGLGDRARQAVAVDEQDLVGTGR
jgi:hypothetical protein